VDASSATAAADRHASLGGVVEGRQVVESPLNGRNVNNLLDFIPGVVPGGGTAGNTVANGGSGSFQVGTQTQAIAYGNYQIGGGFSGQSLFFIDGVLSNIPENNVNSLVPTQDSVQEFRVSTNNVTAEFGGFAGGVVQISTKQGTNQFHGTVYEYFRNTVLDANDYFTTSTVAAPAAAPEPVRLQRWRSDHEGQAVLLLQLRARAGDLGRPGHVHGADDGAVGGDFSVLGFGDSARIPPGRSSSTRRRARPTPATAWPNVMRQPDRPTALKLLQLEYPLPNTPAEQRHGEQLRWNRHPLPERRTSSTRAWTTTWARKTNFLRSTRSGIRTTATAIRWA
jgi:hypothetical protein